MPRMTKSGRASLLIPVHGFPSVIHPAGKRFTLTELQTLVGGNIVCVAVLQEPDGRMMFGDANAEVTHSPVNEEATLLYAEHGYSRQPRSIVGPVVVIAPEERP
jgi:uncharacterized protein DUF3846